MKPASCLSLHEAGLSCIWTCFFSPQLAAQVLLEVSSRHNPWLMQIHLVLDHALLDYIRSLSPRKMVHLDVTARIFDTCGETPPLDLEGPKWLWLKVREPPFFCPVSSKQGPPGYLLYERSFLGPSYMGVIPSHYKDPYIDQSI